MFFFSLDLTISVVLSFFFLLLMHSKNGYYELPLFRSILPFTSLFSSYVYVLYCSGKTFKHSLSFEWLFIIRFFKDRKRIFIVSASPFFFYHFLTKQNVVVVVFILYLAKTLSSFSRFGDNSHSFLAIFVCLLIYTQKTDAFLIGKDQINRRRVFSYIYTFSV